MKLITLQEAQEITARPSAGAVRKFIERWNKRNPGMLILCIHGRVDRESLEAVLRHQVSVYPSGLAEAKAPRRLPAPHVVPPNVLQRLKRWATSKNRMPHKIPHRQDRKGHYTGPVEFAKL